MKKAVQHLQEKGYNPGLVNVRFIRPMDEDLLRELAAKYPLIVTVEENELIGGYGQMVSAFLHKNKYHNDLLSLGISDYFVASCHCGTAKRTGRNRCRFHRKVNNR